MVPSLHILPISQEPTTLSMEVYIWKAHTEGNKHKLLWLLVQSKILTADKVNAKNCSSNPMCCLCDQEPEDPTHLCLHCVFMREVWMLMNSWSGGLIPLTEAGVSRIGGRDHSVNFQRPNGGTLLS